MQYELKTEKHIAKILKNLDRDQFLPCIAGLILHPHCKYTYNLLLLL